MTPFRAVWLLLVGVLAGLAIGCGDDAPTAPDDARAGTHSQGREAEPLALPAGQPVVWVRTGQRLELYDRPGGRVIEVLEEETEWGSPTAFAVMRERHGWAGVPTPYTGNDELAWVRLDSEVLGASAVEWALEIDLSEFRAALLRGGEVVRSFTVTVGAPGMETPTGRFAVTDTFRGGLNPAYGCCAVALTARQPHVPSGWLGGDRIAIHGTSGPIGAAVSHGCVRAADRDVNALVNKVPVGTPVTIRS